MVSIATLSEFQALAKRYGLRHAVLRGDFLTAALTVDKNSASKVQSNPLHLIRKYKELANDTLADEWANAQDASFQYPHL